MATTLSLRPNHAVPGPDRPRSTSFNRACRGPVCNALNSARRLPRGVQVSRRILTAPLRASRADDSAPSEMSVEFALKLLGVSEGASFERRIRSSLPVEAAYDMLLMQSLSQRLAGKVVNSNIRYADVNPVNAPTIGSLPKWLQDPVRNSPVSVEAPSTSELGVQAGVYGALMVLTYVNGATAPSSAAASYAGADLSGLVLATSFGASLYIMTKKNVKLGKATVITMGGLMAGAAVGSAGCRSTSFRLWEYTPQLIIFSQFLISSYLR